VNSCPHRGDVAPVLADRRRSAAVAAARRGWHVFPCRQDDKRPAIDRWEERASASPAHVAAAWRSRYPSANIGIAAGPSGLVVIDLDTPEHGGRLPADWAAQPGIRDGRDVLATLAERSGQLWPCTYSVTTPSGGLHLYFAAVAEREIRNSAGKIGPMIDVRAMGGYVLGAGSVIGGRTYEVLDDLTVEPLPGWLADLAGPPPPRSAQVPAAPTDVAGSMYGRLRAVVQTVLDSEPGTRNGRLYWAARRAAEMIARGQLDRATAERVLLAAAMEAGLRGGECEAARTIASGLGRI
jgi:hypothetical protein